MKLSIPLLMLLLGLVVVDAANALSVDTLTEVRKRGVLVAGVRDSLAPFGFVDKQGGQIVGYDIDYVNAIARKLGVKVKLKPVTPANRITLLQKGDVDIIAAAMTKSVERTAFVDFSLTYFLTGQRFIAKKGTIQRLADLKSKVVGVAKGTTAADILKRALPDARIRYYDGYYQVIQALRRGDVEALTTDDIILNGIFINMPDKEEFEIAPLQISGDTYGLGIPKGDKHFLEFVNATILELEKSGEADGIFDKWFGPDTPYKLKKNFNRK